MANLAIRGHETRGKEVIEILEMIGGKNKYRYDGDLDIWYILSCDIITSVYLFEEKGFTLEEFLEKYPYKVGDFVRIPEYETKVCIDDMKWDGFEIQYLVSADETEYEWYSVEELKPCKEEIMEETNKAIFEGNAHCCDIMNDIIKDNIKERKYAELRMPLDDDDKLSTEVTIDGNKIFPPNNYLIGKVTQVDNGMLVEFVKKQPNYPKTYEECCYSGYDEEYTDKHLDLIRNFQKLKLCRDAYWKIAGEQMGLGKPWEPDFTNDVEVRYGMYTAANKVVKDFCGVGDVNTVLTFPTEEMRDVFYENFKDLIEECKELL